MKKIVLVSILKSVLDTRMYEKLGKSIAKIDNSEIHIIGQVINRDLPNEKNIHFHPIFNFARFGKERLFAPLKALHKIIKIRPDTLVIGTHELLWIGTFYTFFFHKKLIYNVEENYIKNIWYTNAFPKILRPFLVTYIFIKEWYCSLFIKECWLAEKNYEQELGFATWKKYKIIENKHKGNIQSRLQKKQLQHFVYTGTIGEHYGIFECIQLIDQLHQLDENIHLTIIGYCAQNSVLEKLKEYIRGKQYIKLIGGNYIVPHSEILEKIQEADAGFLSYQANPSTNTRIPTKLYEYLSYQLPIISVKNTYWEQIINHYQAGICTDFGEIEFIFETIRFSSFYPNPVDNSVLWSTEEEKLMNSF